MSWKTEKWKSHNQNSKNKKKSLKNEDSLKDLWDNIKSTNICIIKVPEGEEREKGVKNIFDEIMAEKFSNTNQKTDIQVQESQRVPNKRNPKRPTPLIS